MAIATWKNTTLVNKGGTASSQNDPVIVGLSNGNYLVAWVDNNSTTAPQFGSDIVGKIYDPYGHAIQTVNISGGYGHSRNERNPSIAATDDGGFIVAYEFKNGDEADIIFKRFTDSGGVVYNRLLVNDTNDIDTYVAPSVTFRPDGNSFVSYTYHNGSGTSSILGRAVSDDGTIGSEITLRASAQDPIQPDSATLNNGTVVTAYLEKDGTDYDIEVRGIDTSNNSVIFVEVAGPNTTTEYEPHIAALAGGGFVVVWADAGGDVYGRVYNASGVPQTSVLTLAGNSDNKNEVDVIGLHDGGFFVIWDDDTDDQLEGRSFDASGAPSASSIDISTNADGPGNSVTQPELGLTADGRILVTWTNDEIYTKILDQRGNDFTANAPNMETVARSQGGTIYGTNGSDTLTGRGSVDVLFGRGSDDVLSGGKSGDYLSGGGGWDDLYGDKGDDELFGGVGKDYMFGGKGRDTMSGGDGSDTMYGNSGKDTMYGGKQMDNLFGGSERDTLLGGKHDDYLTGGKGGDTLTGGSGEDVFVFNAVSDSTTGSGNRDVVTDYKFGTDIFDVSGIDANVNTGGNQAFTFIGGAAFNGTAGQMRGDIRGSTIVLQADVDGDGHTDLAIEVLLAGTIATSSFIL